MTGLLNGCLQNHIDNACWMRFNEPVRRLSRPKHRNAPKKETGRKGGEAGHGNKNNPFTCLMRRHSRRPSFSTHPQPKEEVKIEEVPDGAAGSPVRFLNGGID